jgi:hypothetical protein
METALGHDYLFMIASHAVHYESELFRKNFRTHGNCFRLLQ